MANAIERPAARVILLDGIGRVLLFGIVEGVPPQTLWVAPGGGLEPGESYPAAARRELREETGLEVAIGPCVWRREHRWYSAAQRAWYRSVERFFVARTARAEVRGEGWTEAERESILRHRWWTVDEIAASRDLFAPRRLAELLPPLLRGELPPAPLDVGA